MRLNYMKPLHIELLLALGFLSILGYFGYAAMTNLTQSSLAQSERSMEISHLKDLKFLNTAIILEIHKAAGVNDIVTPEVIIETKELLQDYYSIIDEKEAYLLSQEFDKRDSHIYQEIITVLKDFKTIREMIFRNFFPLIEEKKDFSTYLYVILNSLQTNVDNLEIIIDLSREDVLQSLNQMKDSGTSFLQSAIIFFIIICIIFLVLVILTHRRSEKPLAKLIHAIQHIGYGNTDMQKLSDRKDSIGVLSKIVKEIDIEIFKKTQLIEENERKLLHQAHYDTLTSLPNRFLMHERLNQSIKKVSRNGDKIALLFIDLDRFKEINDSLGHHIGDRVLQEVSKKFLSCLRDEDTLSRLGGDEFTIMVDDLKEIQDIHLLAKRLVEVLEEPIWINEHEFYISSSIGVSIYPDHGTDIKTLLKNSDLAMYKAKNGGRNNYKLYNIDMSKDTLENITMEADIHKALLNEQFEVYYQPQINIKTDKVIGMEALVRWNHPQKGMISPFEFIGLAEEMGVINKIDEYVCERVCRQIVKWKGDGDFNMKIAVNLSGQQLHRDDLVETILTILEKTKCDPRYLALEVTEGFIMSDAAKSIKILNEFRSIGIDLAIDDFGTGYSSLSYLKRLPVTKLKIDKSFVDHITQNEQDRAIVETIISLAKALNLSVIAEGVETQEQNDCLKALGCFEIQGYLYSRPIPQDEAREFYLKNSSQKEKMKVTTSLS